MVLKYLGWDEPKTVSELHWDILNDYGTTTVRTVHRTLARLLDARKIKRIEVDGISQGYVRTGRRPRRGRLFLSDLLGGVISNVPPAQMARQM
jgi:hypothetical protein